MYVIANVVKFPLKTGELHASSDIFTQDGMHVEIDDNRRCHTHTFLMNQQYGKAGV
jgi:hypothetical protein